DIEMPGENGLEWLARLKRAAEPPAVIMTTAWSEYALPAIQQGADGYLLKPVKAPALAQALEQAQKRNRLQAQTSTQVPLNLDGSGQYINLSTLLYCAAESRWVRVVTKDGEFVSDRPLKQWETEFGHCLVRAHRGYLVHQNAVTALQREDGQYLLTTQGGHSLPVSRRHVKSVRARLTQP
ncbi:MAG: LytTR family DNA-binding domain-containing protein, partial [Natronospirillum sp.]